MFVTIPPMRMPNRDVVAVVYDGLCTFEFGIATELFGLDRPELDVDWYDFSVVSVDDGPIGTIGGMELRAPVDFRRIEAAGTIILPGWRSLAETPPTRLLDALRRAHDGGARLVSICSGVFVLAATGLLDGFEATTHWRYVEQLRSAFPQIEVRPDVLYVDNGQTLTSAGSAAGIDLGLHLIRRDFGAAVANQVARRLVLPAHRDGGQAQFIAAPIAQADEHPLSATLAWALERLHEPLSVDDLARHAAMSERTFVRRFADATGTTPHRWISAQRIVVAQGLLETTSLGMDDVADHSGFGSAANLRRHFERACHTTPTKYRAAFQSASAG